MIGQTLKITAVRAQILANLGLVRTKKNRLHRYTEVFVLALHGEDHGTSLPYKTFAYVVFVFLLPFDTSFVIKYLFISQHEIFCLDKARCHY